MQEPWGLDRRGADDDVSDAIVEIAFDRIEVADTAAQLDRDLVANSLDHRLDRLLVLRLAGKGAVQVDQVQAPCAFSTPVFRHGAGVFGKDRGVSHHALLQADTMSILEVNRRNDQHGGNGLREVRC